MSTEETVRHIFHAYETGDAEVLHTILADDFKFSAPPDPHLDKDNYIRRCWPFHEQKPCYNFEEFFIHGERAMVLYTCTTNAKKKIRNAEYFEVRDGKLAEVVVFFGPEMS
jgi:ketosteroid isomerase-like protein